MSQNWCDNFSPVRILIEWRCDNAKKDSEAYYTINQFKSIQFNSIQFNQIIYFISIFAEQKMAGIYANCVTERDFFYFPAESFVWMQAKK